MEIDKVIEKIVNRVTKKDIDYSKNYEFYSLAFDPISQTITGQDTSGKLGVISLIPIYSLSPFKFTMIPPGTYFLVSFIDGNPGRPICAGIKMSSTGISANVLISNTPAGTLTISN